MQEGIYVTHWQGEFEGRDIRSITVSTGFRAMKLSYEQKIDVDALDLKEGDKIRFATKLMPTKAEGHKAVITKLDKVQ
jgi:ribosomal protein L21